MLNIDMNSNEPLTTIWWNIWLSREFFKLDYYKKRKDVDLTDREIYRRSFRLAKWCSEYCQFKVITNSEELYLKDCWLDNVVIPKHTMMQQNDMLQCIYKDDDWKPVAVYISNYYDSSTLHNWIWYRFVLFPDEIDELDCILEEVWHKFDFDTTHKEWEHSEEYDYDKRKSTKSKLYTKDQL